MLFAGETEAGHSAPPVIFLHVTLKSFPVLPDSCAVFLLCFSHAQRQHLSGVSLPEYDVCSQLISLIYQPCTHSPISLYLSEQHKLGELPRQHEA